MGAIGRARQRGQVVTCLLKTAQLTIRFGGLCAVDCCDLEIREGELFGLIGPNGAGKTTVFNMLTGVYEPSEGTVTFNGVAVNGMSPPQVAAPSGARA